MGKKKRGKAEYLKNYFERDGMPAEGETIANEITDLQELIGMASSIRGRQIFSDESLGAPSGWLLEFNFFGVEDPLIFRMPAEMSADQFMAWAKPALDLFKLINSEDGAVH